MTYDFHRQIFFAVLCLNLALPIYAHGGINDTRRVYPKKYSRAPLKCAAVLTPEKTLANELLHQIRTFRNDLSQRASASQSDAGKLSRFENFQHEAEELKNEIKHYLADEFLSKPSLRRCLQEVQIEFDKLQLKMDITSESN